MIREECRGKLLLILVELKETKFANGRQIFRLNMVLVNNVTPLIGYEHSAQGVFQR